MAVAKTERHLGPHPQAIFSLLPENPRSVALLEQGEIHRFVSRIRIREDSSPVKVLDIGPHIGAADKYTLASFGRLRGCFFVPDSSISRFQCTFEVHPTSGAILLCDYSSHHTTRTLGPTAHTFDREPRRVVVSPLVNNVFQFGRRRENPFQFRLIWHERKPKLYETLNQRANCDFRDAKTIDSDDETVEATCSQTRLVTAGKASNFRWTTYEELGVGAFGTVYAAWHIDSGDAMAVKTLRMKNEKDYNKAQREIILLSKLCHPHIVTYIFAHQRDGFQMEICMMLQDGSVADLVKAGTFQDDATHAEDVTRHMLLALEYLDERNIIHRDLKPANILYQLLKRPGATDRYHFRLADFGLSKECDSEHRPAGSSWYMAPEIYSEEARQTTKMDMWSLLVTVIRILQPAATNGFDSVAYPHAWHCQVLAIARGSHFMRTLRPAAELDPDVRASASQMRRSLYPTPAELAWQEVVTTSRRPDVRSRRRSQASVRPVAAGTAHAGIANRRYDTRARRQEAAASSRRQAFIVARESSMMDYMMTNA